MRPDELAGNPQRADAGGSGLLQLGRGEGRGMSSINFRGLAFVLAFSALFAAASRDGRADTVYSNLGSLVVGNSTTANGYTLLGTTYEVAGSFTTGATAYQLNLWTRF
jgi:hypothetical protein